MAFTTYSHYIFGIGNPFASDDRIGLYIIDQLPKDIDLNTVYIKKIDVDIFEINSEFEHISESKRVLIVDAILVDNLPLGTVVVFDVNEKPLADLKFASVSHSLSILDIITMNKVVTKKNLKITFLGIVIKNTEYGEIINDELLNKKDVILDKILKYFNNSNIIGIEY